jgi:outer membrane receptor protein involved in Fe transport
MKRENNKLQCRTSTLLSSAIASCLLMASPHVLGQSVSATLRGQVAAAGETVTATNMDTGLKRSVQAQEGGAYTLAGLPPGTYKVETGAGGQAASQVVTLHVGQTATLDLMAAHQPIDTVTVVATHLYETRTSEVASYVSQEQIALLPQNSRNFLAFADVVPGVQFVQNGDGSTSELRSGAQSSNGVNVFIDGVGQKNYVLRGGVAGQTLSRGNPFPQLGVGEYKVITSNYKAEFDQLSSAAIVAVTRSGTNDFEVEGFWDKTSEDWRAADPLEARVGLKAKSKQEQYGVSVGGPIIQDQMHFFVTYERKEFETPRTVRFGAGTTPPGGQFANLLGVLNSPFEEDLFFGKIDWTIGDSHLLELTGKIREESELQGLGDQNSATFASTKDNDESRWDLRYQYNGNGFLNDMHVTYEDAAFNPRPVTTGPGFWLTTNDRNQVILRFGGGQDFQDKGQQGYGFQDDLTFNAFDWHGGHTVKTGVKFKAVEINAFEQQPYNPQFYLDVTNDINTPYLVRFGATMPGVPERNVTSRNKQFGIYLQDDWEVTDKLLLNLGVRWDYEETPSYVDHVTPADVVAGLNAPNPADPTRTYAQSLALGGVDVNDYISTGNNRDAFKGAIQPRLGFAYDLQADQRHVLFGGAGRSYDRNVFDYLALERSKGTFPSYERFFNVDGHACTPGVGSCLAWDPSFFDPANLAALVAENPSLGREINLINNDLQTPYSDQFSLGIRNRVALWNQDWNTTVTLSHIVSKDGIVFLLGNRYPDGSFRPPGTTWGGQPWGNGVPGLGTLIVAKNGLETRANSLLLQAEKPYTHESGWGVTLAYTYTDAEENRSNVATNDEHYIFDYPEVGGFGWHQSTGVAEHRLVGTAIYDAPFGIVASAKLTLASPLQYEAVNCFNASDWNHCFFQNLDPDTTIGYKQLDVSVQKVWDSWGGVKLRLRADVFNLLNYENVDRYETWRGGPGEANAAFGTPQAYYQPTRTFKLSFGMNW